MICVSMGKALKPTTSLKTLLLAYIAGLSLYFTIEYSEHKMTNTHLSCTVRLITLVPSKYMNVHTCANTFHREDPLK